MTLVKEAGSSISGFDASGGRCFARGNDRAGTAETLPSSGLFQLLFS